MRYTPCLAVCRCPEGKGPELRKLARWLGCILAAAALMVAAALVFQAHPDRAGAGQANWYERCMQERAARTADSVLSNRSFQLVPGCGEAPRGWDKGLILRATVAGGIGVALLVAAFLVPRLSRRT